MPGTRLLWYEMTATFDMEPQSPFLHNQNLLHTCNSNIWVPQALSYCQYFRIYPYVLKQCCK